MVDAITKAYETFLQDFLSLYRTPRIEVSRFRNLQRIAKLGREIFLCLVKRLGLYCPFHSVWLSKSEINSIGNGLFHSACFSESPCYFSLPSFSPSPSLPLPPSPLVPCVAKPSELRRQEEGNLPSIHGGICLCHCGDGHEGN